MASSELCLKKGTLNIIIMKQYFFLISILCALFSLRAENPASLPQEEPQELVIYNRILAKVNGKTLSVIDVVKKMDLFLQKNYPQLADSKAARHQFFADQWKNYLNQMIDAELMLADADRLQVKVSEAEVREEILNRFGPNIMPTLDKLGVSYEDAKTMIHNEMIVQKMIWFRVNSKALMRVNSQDVKTAYQQHIEKNPEMQQWDYQVLTIRSSDQTASQAVAAKAFDLLQSRLALTQIPEEIKKTDETVTISLSEEIQANDKTIALSHREILKTLQPLTYSKPIAQVSKDNSVVFRIFYLKDHSIRTVPSFKKIAEQLKETLLQEEAGKEQAHYILKLRERLGYDEKHMLEPLPSDFQPFALR